MALEPYQVEITVKRGSKRTELKIEGVKGPSCAAIAAPFDALGKRVEDEATAEMYEQETAAPLTTDATA